MLLTVSFHVGMRPQCVHQTIPPPVAQCPGMQAGEMLQCALPSDQICAMWDLEPQMCGGHHLHSLDLSSLEAWARHRLSAFSIEERGDNMNVLHCSPVSAPAGVNVLPAT